MHSLQYHIQVADMLVPNTPSTLHLACIKWGRTLNMIYLPK